MNQKSEFAFFGLGVMGKSLSCNLELNGSNISFFNRPLNDLEELLSL